MSKFSIGQWSCVVYRQVSLTHPFVGIARRPDGNGQYWFNVDGKTREEATELLKREIARRQNDRC